MPRKLCCCLIRTVRPCNIHVRSHYHPSATTGGWGPSPRFVIFAVVCSSNCSSSDLLCEAASRSFSQVSSSCLRSLAFAAQVKHSSTRAEVARRM